MHDATLKAPPNHSDPSALLPPLACSCHSDITSTPLAHAAEVALLQRDAAELVADRKPAYLQLKAGEQGSHFLLIEVRQPLLWQLCC